MKRRTDSTPSVLVVEDHAHRPVGHSPVSFAGLVEGFDALGFHVEALTSRGWYLENEWQPSFRVHRYGPVARTLDHLADRLSRNRRRPSVRGWLRRAGGMLRVVAMVGAARARCRRMPKSTAVIIVSNSDAPALTSALAGRGHWLTYVFFPPHVATTSWGALSDRLIERVADRAERRRRADGGGSVVAAPGEVLRREWAARLPALEVGVVPLASSGDAHTVPGAGSPLGIDPSVRVALLFGAVYPEKDPDVVARAFEHLVGWQLVVAGTLADTFPSSSSARRFPGFVDNRTRAAVFNAADLVVLSFRPGFARDSGVLSNADTWGVPVVCSDRCAPADLVREYRLGVIFEPGDADSLAAAVRAAPRAIDPADLVRARSELSSRTVAARATDALAIRG